MSNESYCPGNNNYGRDKKLPTSNEKNKAEGVEEAAESEYPYVQTNSYSNDIRRANRQQDTLRLAFTAGANWQRNDPAFIAEIVEKTLAYVIAIDQDDTLLSLSSDIVNQILNEKL